MNTDLFIDLLTWFIKEIGHKWYVMSTHWMSVQTQSFYFKKWQWTDGPVDTTLECKNQGKAYNFSSEVQHPTKIILYLIIQKTLLRQCLLKLLKQCQYLVEITWRGMRSIWRIRFLFNSHLILRSNSWEKDNVKDSNEVYMTLHESSLIQFMQPDFMLVVTMLYVVCIIHSWLDQVQKSLSRKHSW